LDDLVASAIDAGTLSPMDVLTNFKLLTLDTPEGACPDGLYSLAKTKFDLWKKSLC